MHKNLCFLAALALLPAVAAADDFGVTLAGNGQGFASIVTTATGVEYSIVTDGLGGIDSASLRKGGATVVNLGASTASGAASGSASASAATIADIDANPSSYSLVVQGPNGSLTGTLAKAGDGPDPDPDPEPGECASGFTAYQNNVSDEQFCVRVTIETPEGASIPGSLEACQLETLCFSGQVAGRSEVFVRVIGPRPNGFFWPTVLRFTPSQVTVEIEQVSSDIERTYVLDEVPANTDDLSGLQDREGFAAEP